MNKKKENRNILTRKEASKYLSVSLSTLKFWTDQGLIKSYQLGGRIYYKEVELFEALKPV